MNEAQIKYKLKRKAEGTFNRGNRADQTKRYYSNRPLVRAAHNAIAKAALKGKLIKPSICSLCGTITDNIIGHHGDYTKPLDVIWVCWSCHNNLHKHGGNEEVIEL